MILVLFVNVGRLRRIVTHSGLASPYLTARALFHLSSGNCARENIFSVFMGSIFTTNSDTDGWRPALKVDEESTLHPSTAN